MSILLQETSRDMSIIKINTERKLRQRFNELSHKVATAVSESLL